MNIRFIFRLALLPALMQAGGCATRTLWSDAANHWNEPARIPNLRLYQTPQSNDFLVAYDELSEKRDAVRPRAYLLHQNQACIDRNQSPSFIVPVSADGLPLLPMYFTTNAPLITVPPFPRVVAATNERSFDIVSDARTVASYSLPVYRDRLDYPEIAVIQPWAALADVSIVGGLVVYWTWPAAGQLAASFVNK